MQNGAFVCSKSPTEGFELCRIVCEKFYAVNPLQVFKKSYDCNNSDDNKRVSEVLKYQRACLGRIEIFKVIHRFEETPRALKVIYKFWKVQRALKVIYRFWMLLRTLKVICRFGKVPRALKVIYKFWMLLGTLKVICRFGKVPRVHKVIYRFWMLLRIPKVIWKGTKGSQGHL